MTSNRRSVTTHMHSDSASRPASRVTESYSSNLMDDLFGDVDRILDGDLSDCMTVVKPQRKATHTTTRTVQLPSDFTGRSAADIYNATVAAMPATVIPPAPPRPAVAPSAYRQASSSARRRTHSYSRGGRPVTPFRASAAQSGNFQSAVIQTPNAGTTTVDVRPISNSLYPEPSLADVSLSAVSPRSPQTIFEPKKPQSVSLPFLLVGAAGMSVASTIGLWSIGQSASGGWLASLNTEASAAEIPNTDKDFLAYLQLSLDNISTTRSTPSQTVAVIPTAAPASALPTVVPNVNPAPALGALPNLPGAKAAPNVIERVFVPVYQNAQQSNQAIAAQPTNTALPNVATPARNTARPTVPVPAPVAAAAAIPPGAPAAATASVPIVNSNASELPAPVTTAAASTNTAITNLTDVTPTSELALVGVLNLGSRSAALFDIDGTSQRAYVGDRIGLSDWTLVSVNGQDVVIRRDGEVRSVYIGQRF